MSNGKYSWLGWLCYFILFELVMYFGLGYILSGMGETNQVQPENTIVPNWVKAVSFILLYILGLLIVVMMVSNMMPSRHRGQLMRWVYLALLGMVMMLFLLFN